MVEYSSSVVVLSIYVVVVISVVVSIVVISLVDVKHKHTLITTIPYPPFIY